MKNRFIYIMCVAGIMMSCSHEENLISENGNVSTEKMLILDVSIGKYSNSSRTAIDGVNLTFVKDDVVGVWVKDNNKTYNVPYRYDGEEWSFDITVDARMFEPSEGKIYNYVVYFPYNKEADNVQNLDELKGLFEIKADQSSESNYNLSDFMYDEISGSNNISADLQHVNTLFLLKPLITYTEKKFAPIISELKVNIGEKEYTPYALNNGEYRLILPASDIQQEITWSYSHNEKNYGNSIQTSRVANSAYIVEESLGVYRYNIENTKEGDYLCINDNASLFALPGDRVDLSKKISDFTCIGIVFHSGKHPSDDCDYKGLIDNTVHGYAMALKDLPDQSSSAKGQVWAKNDYKLKIETSTSMDKWDGYYNTHKIYDEAKENLENFPLAYQCSKFETKAPINSSGWFIPSVAQMMYIFEELGKFNAYLDKVEGSELLLSKEWIWTSTTYSGNKANAVYVVGDTNGNYDKTHHCDTRPILVF